MRIKKSLLILVAILLLISTLVACTPLEIPSDELEILTSNVIPKPDDSLRIMSANVLVHIKSWGGEPVKPRANYFAKAIQQYMPDVIGAQEFCRDWYSSFVPMIKDLGYKIIKENYSAFIENRTPIIYNTNTLELIENGIYLYSQGDNNGCRVVTWAVFQRKSDNKIFAVTSTHLDLIRTNKEEIQLDIMLLQVDEMLTQIDKIATQYNCPIIMTGDYNCMEKAEYLEQHYYGAVGEVYSANTVYTKIVDKYRDAKFVENIDTYDFGGGILPNGAWDSPTWDHIFVTDNVEVKAFAVLSSIYFQRYEDRTSRISDHLPIFVDFGFI